MLSLIRSCLCLLYCGLFSCIVVYSVVWLCIYSLVPLAKFSCVALYEEMVHTYHFYVPFLCTKKWYVRTVSYRFFVRRNGMYVPFLCMKKRYETLRTISLYKKCYVRTVTPGPLLTLSKINYVNCHPGARRKLIIELTETML